MTTRPDVLREMLSTIRRDMDTIEDCLSLADPSVERDIRLASEACRLRLLQHAKTRSLFEGAA